MTSGDLQPLGPDDLARLDENLQSELPNLLQTAKNALRRPLIADQYEDVTHSAILKLWMAIARYSPEKDPRQLPPHLYFSSAYAHTTVRNEAITAIRAAKRRLKEVTPTTQDFDTVVAARGPDTIGDEEEQKKLQAVLNQALSELQPRDSAIVRALRCDICASPAQQRAKAEEYLGEPIPATVFATAKSRAVRRMQAAVARAMARAESHSRSRTEP